MNPCLRRAMLLALGGFCALALLAGTGCKQNPFQPAGTAAAPGALGAGNANSLAAQQEKQKLATQLQDLNSRLASLDGNNSDLLKQNAERDRQLAAAQEQVNILQKQLGETAGKLKESLAARQAADNQVNALQASTRFKGGAAITANNSVKQTLAAVNLPGLEVRQDGEVIRIEIPADRLFVPNSAQLNGNAYQILDEVANAVARNYPRQRIIIEGHSDGSGGATASVNHLLAAAQSQAVFQQMVQRNRLPPRQLSILAVGDNHPLAAVSSPEGRAKNRRVEVVVYPDQFEG